MELKEKLKNYNVSYFEDIPYFVIDDYIFSYYKLKNKECFTLCINKPLIHKSDLNIINKKYKKEIKLIVDNIAFKNDLIYVYLYDYDNIYEKLQIVVDELSSLTYKNRNNCVVCGNKAPLNRYKDVLIPIDDKCIDKLNNEEIENINKNNLFIKKSINYATIASLITIILPVFISFLLGNYSIISTILMFLPPFIAHIFYNKTPMNRTRQSDLHVFIISLLSIFVCHILIMLLFIILYQVPSIVSYFKTFNILIVQSLIESILFYIIGFISGSFIVKKRAIIRLQKKKI